MNATLAEKSKAERHSFADEFRSFALANSIEMEPGYKFSREDAAERSGKRPDERQQSDENGWFHSLTSFG